MAWTKGGRRGTGRVFEKVSHRCRRGKNLASVHEFDAQKELSNQWMDWYGTYVLILARLRARQGGGVLHAFCGGGGSTEGERRAGGSGSHGIDIEDQPGYVDRFGAESFTQADALSWSKVTRVRDRHGLYACFASPPCKDYSTARRKDQPSKAPPLIPQTRAMLQALFDYWAIENVMGAKKHMSDHAVQLDGALFGLEVARARLIESNFEVTMDESVTGPAEALRMRTCLGKRRRWKRVDRWGRIVETCCEGNIFAVQGMEPYKCTTEQCARAMGMDVGHMSYDRLAQSLPPAYVQLLYAQLCMRVLEREYGVQPISFDEHLRDPEGTRLKLQLWLRGAGDPSPEAGLHTVTAGTASTADHRSNPDRASKNQTRGQPDGIGGSELDAGFRELYYSKHGGFDALWKDGDDAHDMERLRPHTRFMQPEWNVSELTGLNTLVEMSSTQIKRWAPKIALHVQGTGPGTRVAVILRNPNHAGTPWSVKRVMSRDTHFAKYDLRDGFWRVPVSLELQKRLVMRHPGNARMIWCRSLPFGFIDSPRLFCSITEAVAQEFRRRVGQKQHSGEIPSGGIHLWCYVDDYLVAGDNAELTRIGCQIFEELMHELGFEWAPSKQRGPCKCIEFLGLLLVNMPGQQCIALTRKRQEYLTTLLHEWSERRAKLSAEGSDPKEMAHLLGHLVFASQVIPGGRVFMQSMLQQFQGLEVNWKLGLVRPVGDGQWAKVHVSEGFWDDLDWWTDHLATRNCTSLAYSETGAAAVTGTDASDWGSGQAVYIDGGVEEARLEFTSAEKRRPINWRELSGIIRIFERYGSRLAGQTILVETDNMSAKGAASKMASSSEDMAELIRRLLELAERHDVRVKLMHTPGEKLHRPDQSSRGNPIEEPRARVREEVFRALEHRFGPFTELVGCERRLVHATPVGKAQSFARQASTAIGREEPASQEEERACNMWLHPSFALSLIHI